MNINELLNRLVMMKGSDLHISVGCAPYFRVNGVLINMGSDKLTTSDTKELVKQLATEEQIKEIDERGD